MKPRNLCPPLILSLAVFVLAMPSAHAGLLAILRGDALPDQEVRARVAFIGWAEVKEVQGSAFRLDGIDHWKPLARGASLSPGDVIRSGNGSVILRMTRSGSLVQIHADTVLRLLPLERDWERSVLSGQEERNGFAVRACRGGAEYQNQSGGWHAVKVNAVLPEGVIVRTEPGASLDLFHTQDKRPLRIASSTELTLNEAALSTRLARRPVLAAISSAK